MYLWRIKSCENPHPRVVAWGMAWRTDLPNYYADDFDYDTLSPVARQLYVHELDEEIASFRQQYDQRFHGGSTSSLVRLGDDAFPFRAIGRLAILQNLDNPLDCLEWSSVASASSSSSSLSSRSLTTQQTISSTGNSSINGTLHPVPRVAFELASRYCLKVWLSSGKSNSAKPPIALPSSFALSNRIALLCRCLTSLDAFCDNQNPDNGETLEWMICLECCLHVHACLYLMRHSGTYNKPSTMYINLIC